MPSSPFDDPELRAQMAKMGVVHQPGMAADLLKEVAPLLKADGVDLDDLGDTDLETLNAAMARATERHNLELLTPIGAQRDAALAKLHSFTAAIAADDDTRARAIIESVEPEATAPAPSVSHVLGVSLGLLDDWYSDDSLRPALRSARVPAWHRKSSRTAASDVLAIARKGRAFDAADSLIRRHRGLGALEGASLVIAASLIAGADAERTPLDEFADRMLRRSAPRENPSPQHPTSPGSSFTRPSAQAPNPPASKRGRGISGNPARRSADLADQRLLRDFSRWLDQQGFEKKAGIPVRQHSANLAVLLNAARVVGLDLNDPEDFDDIVDVVFDSTEEDDREDREDILFEQLDLLHDYVHFQMDSGDPDAWAQAHQSIEAALSEVDEGPSPLEDALAESALIPADERLAAYLQLPIVQSVHDLLAWIGNSRAVTPAGAVRRADIAELAGFLGIDAVGVARVLDPFAKDPRQVQSMGDIAEVRSWWEALQICELIEVTATRVRPGPEAASWTTAAEPPFELVEKLIGMFVAKLVDPNEGGKRFEHVAADAVLRGLIIAVSPEAAEHVNDDDNFELFAAVTNSRMRQLAALRLVEETTADVFVVPDALRGAVAGGLMTALTLMAAMEDLGVADWE